MNLFFAEIPNESMDKELYDIVTTQMIHGPCGIVNNKSQYIKDGRCTKTFPKYFLKFTQAGEDDYPKLRCRRLEYGGEECTTKRNNMQVIIDNRWVVPYCPLLSKICKAHINVEFCNSVKNIKYIYIFKYINKGSDMSIVALQEENGGKDDISDYQLGRYVGSNEAFWRLMQFPIHTRFPTIIHLAVYCTLYIVHCTLYSVHCTVYIVQCTLYSVHCTVYIVQCTLYSVHCTVYIVQCTLYNVQCTFR